VPRFAVRPVGDWFVAGTGYTGEDGVESTCSRRPFWRGRDRRRGSRRSPGSARHVAARGGPAASVTSSAPAHARCRRGWDGWCAGTRATSQAVTRPRPSASGSRAACAGLDRGAPPAQEGAPVLDRRRGSGRRHRAATSRRRSAFHVIAASRSSLPPDVEIGAGAMRTQQAASCSTAESPGAAGVEH
jgi:hypothetical protein